MDILKDPCVMDSMIFSSTVCWHDSTFTQSLFRVALPRSVDSHATSEVFAFAGTAEAFRRFELWRCHA